MTKLLVLGRIQKPIPPSADFNLERLSKKLESFGDVYTLTGLEGFAAVLDLDSLEVLDSILAESEFSKIGKTEILPMARI